MLLSDVITSKVYQIVEMDVVKEREKNKDQFAENKQYMKREILLQHISFIILFIIYLA